MEESLTRRITVQVERLVRELGRLRSEVCEEGDVRLQVHDALAETSKAVSEAIGGGCQGCNFYYVMYGEAFTFTIACNREGVVEVGFGLIDAHKATPESFSEFLSKVVGKVSEHTERVKENSEKLGKLGKCLQRLVEHAKTEVER